jgi:hypothetical protein
MSEGLGPQIDYTDDAGPAREQPTGRRAVRRMYPREPQEHYVEEPWVSRRLLEEREYGPVVVDPCAGFGHVVASARSLGLRAYGSDLVKRAPGVAGGCDFLSDDWRPPRRAGADFAIVCNPPFGGRAPLIRQCAELALARARHVALLVPVKRLAAAGVWLERLPLVETLHIDRRTSLWPGRIYAAKIAAGEKLRNGFDDVVWLRFDAQARPRRASISWLRRDG